MRIGDLEIDRARRTLIHWQPENWSDTLPETEFFERFFHCINKQKRLTNITLQVAVNQCGTYRIRTSDLLRVKQAL